MRMINNINIFTIEEAANRSGKSIPTIYRMITDKKIKSISKRINGKKIKFVTEEEFTRVFPDAKSTTLSSSSHDNITDNITNNTSDIKDNIEAVITKIFNDNILSVYKPLEENALVKYGETKKENEFLRQRLEVLVQDNEDLKQQMKALPDQKIVQELQDKLKQEEDTKLKLQEKLEQQIQQSNDEKQNLHDQLLKIKEDKEEAIKTVLTEKEQILKDQEALQKQIELLPVKPEEVKEILLQNADNLKILQGELKDKEIRLSQSDEELKKIKDVELKLQEELALKEESLKAMSQAAEKEKLEIVSAWQKKVEELSRPWWKFW